MWLLTTKRNNNNNNNKSPNTRAKSGIATNTTARQGDYNTMAQELKQTQG
jgi:hypothetical protein